jgi:nucleoside-diphosphate-sugar epimerase
MSRIVVTGATGFVGLPVVTALARRGAEIHALHRRSPPPEAPGVIWHRVDLMEADACEELMRKIAPERLVHLAWYTEHERVMGAPENVMWVECSLRLARSFVRHGGRRLIMLGSCAEYDWSKVQRPLEETSSPLAPATLYGAAKDALRRVAGAYARQEGIEFAWGRPFFLYGPREAPMRLVPSVTRALLSDRAVAISSGGQVRDYMHVEDLAGAVLALLDSRVQGAVNLASGVGVRLDDVVDQIESLTGRGGLVRRGARPDRPWESPQLVADVARLRDEVGFRSRCTLADGLAATVRWWKERGGGSGKDPREELAAQT